LAACFNLQAEQNQMKNPKFFVFHINGVNTEKDEARGNLDQLIEASTVKSNIVDWSVLYNSTSGLLASDIGDVLRMKRQEGKDLTIDDYVITYMKTYKLDYPIDSPEYNQLKNEIKQKYIDDPSIAGRNLRAIVDQCHGKVRPEFEVVIHLLNEF